MVNVGAKNLCDLGFILKDLIHKFMSIKLSNKSNLHNMFISEIFHVQILIQSYNRVKWKGSSVCFQYNFNQKNNKFEMYQALYEQKIV